MAQPTINVETGLQIERLRQQQSVKALDSLAASQIDHDKAFATYASLSAQLLTARSDGNIQFINRIGDQLSLLVNSKGQTHPHWPLWVMLDAEVQLYDQWAMQVMNPSLLVMLGYATNQQRLLVTESAGRLRRDLAQAMQKLERFPKDVRLLLTQRCGFLLANTAYLESFGDSKAKTALLIQQANNVLKPLLSEKNDAWQMGKQARWLQVQILLANNQVQTASALSLPVAGDVPAKLTLVRLRGAQQRVDAAAALFGQLVDDWASMPPVMQLLVADNLHRFWMQQGEPEKAFAMYLQLLEQKIDSSLRHHLVIRFAKHVVFNTSIDNLPDNVLYVIASELNALAGQGVTPDPDYVAMADRCVQILKTRYLDTEEGPFAQKIELQLAKSLALKILQPRDAVFVLTKLEKLVTEAADNELVYEALSLAYHLFDDLLKQSDANLRANVLSIYQPMARVLFERFNTRQLADNSRLFDVVVVRLPAGEYELALHRLADLPVSHAQYWLSLRYQLGIYRKLIGQTSWPLPRVIAAVIPIRDLALSQLGLLEIAEREQIQQVVIESTGMLWQLAVKQGQWSQAAAHLKGYESAKDFPENVASLWLGRRFVSLQRAGDWAAVNQLSQRILEQRGGRGFPLLMQVLGEMDKKLDSQRKLAMARKVDAIDALLLEATLSLAQAAVKWAVVHVGNEQQVLMAKLIWARSLCDAGQMRDALSLLGPLAEQFEADVALWMTIAQCHFKLEMAANYQQASRIYHTIITQSMPNKEGHFAEQYWHAWVRYLQICDLTKQHTNIIWSRISSLEAEDSELGGEPYRSILLKLKEQYAEVGAKKTAEK
ncbi:MAG: hypothetical protein JKX85_08200 [Phycisphaeraceae bacterium]|nr:hypothetical protein [Phycisphaeraceae bacterium]